jgi:NADPH:quinone reductase-like Zn-dependent oxidoreductase
MQSRARLLTGVNQLQPASLQPVPQPGTHEILIRNMATSLNFHDLIGIEGATERAKLPRVPFSDNAGVVEAVGSSVTEFAVGDRVIAGFFPNWHAGPPEWEDINVVLGDQIDGALQTHFVAPARSVARAPAHLDFNETATLGCAGLTAWRALVRGPEPLRPGDTVVLQGTGGVSLFALSLAKSMGARVILTSSSDDKLAQAAELGVDVGINYRKTANWGEAVLEATGGRGADVVVEVAGGATLPQSIQACRVGGRISLIGVLTGYETARFPLATVLTKNQTISGITVGNSADLRAFCRATEQNNLKPEIDSIYLLDEVDQAIVRMKSQRHFGKIVISLEEK